MLDSTTIRAQLDTAINALTATLGDLFAAEMKRRQATAPKAVAPKAAPKIDAAPKAAPKIAAAPKATAKKVEARPKPQPAAAKPKPVANKAAPATPPKLKPLLGRANVHVVPSQKLSPAPSMASQYVPAVRQGPPPEEIAKKAERMVMAASLPPTFERIRRALRVSKNALLPVIDQLVEDKKICFVDVGGVILYKPPRIEPIRRRRVERPVASGQGL